MAKTSNSKLRKNLFILIILTLSAAFIYTLPYFRSYYYDAFREAFNMTNTEMGLCGTYYGLFGVVSYLVGGVIADKVPISKLISISMIVTGALGFYLLTFPSPFMVALVHGVWGITTILTFWPALIKAIRATANEDEQGRAFGIFESGRGIINTVVFSLAVLIFGYFTSSLGNSMGIQSILIFYSSVTILLGIAAFFLFRNMKEKEEEKKSASGLNFKHIGAVIKKPTLWLNMVILFSVYMINTSYYYFSPYASEAFGVTTVTAALLASSSQYIRPFSCMGTGVLADKINCSKVMLIGEIVSLLGLAFIIFTPAQSSVIPVVIGALIVYAAMYSTQTMHFAIMEEGSFPEESSGTAIGLICMVGFLPDAVAPLLAGRVLDTYTGSEGYQIIFAYLVAFTILAIGATLVWLKITKEKRLEILAKSKEKKQATKS